MRVLMISLDRGLLGAGNSGDVQPRHQRYADAVGSLDVLVMASDKFQERIVAPNFHVAPTKSGKFSHYEKAYQLAVKLHSQKPYDLLVTQEFAAPVGNRVKAKFHIPWIVSIHGMFFSSTWLRANALNWYLLYRIKTAIRTADGFRVNNEVIKDKLREWKIDKPILVQPTAIDVRRFFTKEDGPLKEGRPPGELRTLFVGRLSREKNLPMLIRAIQAIPGALELAIVGSGSEEGRLKEMAAGDKRINFLGPKKYEDLPKIFASADIFVLPSDTESFGQVLFQAAASGLAIVSTTTTGAQGIIHDKQNGLLVPVGDQEALEEAILQLLHDPQLRRRLGEEAINTAKAYDSVLATNRLVEFWKMIVSKFHSS